MKRWGSLALLQLIGMCLYLYGFFPIKSLDRSKANFAEYRQLRDEFPSINVDDCSTIINDFRPKPAFQRLIFIVIDAFRADFLFDSEHMKFLRNMIDAGNAVAYSSNCQPPTVTMPRIKAMTTGTVPSFVDLMLNLASSELIEDNMMHQFNAAGYRMIFFGDDTWLKLFPNAFHRFDGVSSFFVSDFTEVDNNCTRHLNKVLSKEQQNEWDMMFLHYLGLDHIGHSLGPKSLLVAEKLAEMDRIIKRIYDATISQKTLIVIVGDHGMSEIGSHGGASKAETTVPMVFLSDRFKQVDIPAQPVPNAVQQIDLSPTLSAAFGVPIPRNSLGVVVPALFAVFESAADRLAWAHWNLDQLIAVSESNFGLASEIKSIIRAVKLEHMKAVCNGSEPADEILAEYRRLSVEIRNRLILSFAEYKTLPMFAAMVLCWTVFAIHAYSSWPLLHRTLQADNGYQPF